MADLRAEARGANVAITFAGAVGTVLDLDEARAFAVRLAAAISQAADSEDNRRREAIRKLEADIATKTAELARLKAVLTANTTEAKP